MRRLSSAVDVRQCRPHAVYGSAIVQTQNAGKSDRLDVAITQDVQHAARRPRGSPVCRTPWPWPGPRVRNRNRGVERDQPSSMKVFLSSPVAIFSGPGWVPRSADAEPGDTSLPLPLTTPPLAAAVILSHPSSILSSLAPPSQRLGRCEGRKNAAVHHRPYPRSEPSSLCVARRLLPASRLLRQPSIRAGLSQAGHHSLLTPTGVPQKPCESPPVW